MGVTTSVVTPLARIPAAVEMATSSFPMERRVEVSQGSPNSDDSVPSYALSTPFQKELLRPAFFSKLMSASFIEYAYQQILTSVPRCSITATRTAPTFLGPTTAAATSASGSYQTTTLVMVKQLL